MKLSEVFNKYKLQTGKLFDDHCNIGACCLLGAAVLADDLNPVEMVEISSLYKNITDQSPTSQKLADFIRDKYSGELHTHTDIDRTYGAGTILWNFSDKILARKHVDLQDFITQFEQGLEQVETRDLIIDKVEDFVGTGKTFTAFDVTQALRADGVQVFHKDVREEVHAQMAGGYLGGRYEKSNQNFNGNWAIQYTPIVAVPQIALATPQNDPLLQRYKLKQNARGGFGLPAEAMRKIGLKPGQKARVFFDPTLKKIIVAPPQLMSGLSYKGEVDYTVDNCNRVVVTKKFMREYSKEFDKTPALIEVDGFSLKIS